MEKCVFCEIINGKEDYKVWEDNNFIALLDVNPAKKGHLLIIPKKHINDIFDLEEPIFSELFKTAKKLEEPLKKVTDAKRIGMVIVGFSVPHAHLHLVPLHKSNELFDPSMFSKADPEELKKVQQLLKENFKDI
jgi:histidine triad (HIT) family protein